VSQPSVIRVVAKPGRAEAINAKYRQELGEEFLIWTKALIAMRIRAVNAGKIEALAHLRGQINSITDWNRLLPHMAENNGRVLMADHEATLTPLQLLDLRKYFLFLERHRDDFESIEGMETAQMLLGGVGRTGIGVVAPQEPKSEIYVLCVRHKVVDLWVQYYKFRNEPSIQTWAALKNMTVPWRMDRTVESLVKSLPSFSADEVYPSALILRRALLPTSRTKP
jgi:hypothetical protein